MSLHSIKHSDQELAPFELKGGLFTLTVVCLRQMDREAIDRFLEVKTRQAPEFFKNAPVLIDLEGLGKTNESVDFTALQDILRKRGMIPVGVRNGSPELQAAAVLAGLPLFPEGRTAGAPKKAEKNAPAPVQQTKFINQQVRSGQQVYAPDGDLIVLGTISAGAEVLADGNVHIYGTLRGRALAGVKGDASARIFCQNLEAELVAIAGHYRVSEQIEEQTRGKPVQLYLADERLIIEPLSR